MIKNFSEFNNINESYDSLKMTVNGGSYYENGVYKKEYDELYDKLVPNRGQANTLNGELIRSISRLSYEYYNNGNINARYTEIVNEEESCGDCYGSGEIDSEEYDDDNDEYYDVTITCDTCGGEGYIISEVDGESSVSGFYEHFIELIGDVVPNISECLYNIRDIIINDIDFGDYTDSVYNELFDRVIYYVLTNEDVPLPLKYKVD